MNIIRTTPVTLSYPLKLDGSNIIFTLEIGNAQPIYTATYQIRKNKSTAPIRTGEILSNQPLNLGLDESLLGYKFWVLVSVNAQAGLRASVTLTLEGGSNSTSPIHINTDATEIGDLIVFDAYYGFIKP